MMVNASVWGIASQPAYFENRCEEYTARPVRTLRIRVTGE